MSTCPSGACCSSQPVASRTNRFDYALGVQEAFVDYHLRNMSEPLRFRFAPRRHPAVPVRFPRLPVQDQQLGVRLFGNRDNNRFQYNLAAIWRLEKDTNSRPQRHPPDARATTGSCTPTSIRQDFPFVGLTSQASLTWNINRERGEIEVDDNGFPVRPALIGNLRARDYDVFYLGYNVDGHIGRLNLTATAYGAVRPGPATTSSPAATGRHPRASSSPPSRAIDFNWIRIRGSGLFASGDGNPYDNIERGFDAIFENPIFAGADTSYWIRQAIPFAGGGRAVAINGRNGILNSTCARPRSRASPTSTIRARCCSASAPISTSRPQLRLSANVNHLWFAEHRGAAGAAHRGHASRSDIGWDLSRGGDLPAAARPRTSSSACPARCCSPAPAFATCSTNRTATGAIIRSCSTRS